MNLDMEIGHEAAVICEMDSLIRPVFFSLGSWGPQESKDVLPGEALVLSGPM